MLRSLYEAAWREVIADVPAALIKYQPDWVLAFPSGRTRSAVRPVRKSPALRRV
jgi:hypothetical protein